MAVIGLDGSSTAQAMGSDGYKHSGASSGQRPFAVRNPGSHPGHQPPPPNPRSNAMLDFIVRFLEELLDIANFGNDISK